MIMKKSIFKEPKPVLIFSSTRKLIAICTSANKTEDLIRLQPQSIANSCVGRSVMCGNFYVRYLHPNVEISLDDDLGTLDLIQYDKMCGIERFYYRKDVAQLSGRKGKRKLTAKQIALLKK